MYAAQDRVTLTMVAIKRCSRMSDDYDMRNELLLLKNCTSKYVVRYYDVFIDEKDLCVCSFGWIQNRW